MSDNASEKTKVGRKPVPKEAKKCGRYIYCTNCNEKMYYDYREQKQYREKLTNDEMSVQEKRRLYQKRFRERQLKEKEELHQAINELVDQKKWIN